MYSNVKVIWNPRKCVSIACQSAYGLSNWTTWSKYTALGYIFKMQSISIKICSWDMAVIYGQRSMSFPTSLWVLIQNQLRHMSQYVQYHHHQQPLQQRPKNGVCFNFVGLLYTFYMSRVLYMGDCHGSTPNYRNYGCKQNSDKYNNLSKAVAGNRVQTHKMCPTQMKLYKFL